MSVTPLFGTKDPFPQSPVTKSFYYPSSPVRLIKHQKQTVLSPESHRRLKSLQAHDTQVDDFVSTGSNIFGTNLPSVSDLKNDAVVSPSMDESWPTTEQPSSVLEDSHWQSYADPQKFHISDMIGLKQKLNFSNGEDADASRVTVDVSGGGSVHGVEHQDEDQQRQSTLAKYIERFRHGAPESRLERQRNVGISKQDFWWLKSDSNTSLESSDVAKQDKKVSCSQLTKDRLKSGPSLMFMPASPGHAKTEELQRKADHLIEQSESSLNSSDPVVSTEGLGSNTSVSTVVTDDTPYRPAFTRHLLDPVHTRFTPSMPLPRGGNLQPADDILYQWRLHRKMEVAREGLAEPIMNSRLTEFRQKLTRPVMRAPVQFTAAPVQQHDQERNSVYMVNPDVRPQPPETSSCMTQADHSRSDQTDAVHSRYNQLPLVIASPQLLQKQDSETRERGARVDPHVHLLCDILPCPHENQRAFEALAPDVHISAGSYQLNSDLIQNAFCDKYKDLEISKNKACTESSAEMMPVDYTATVVTDGHDRDKSRVRKPECNLLKYRQFLKAEKPHSDSTSRFNDKVKTGDKFKSGKFKDSHSHVSSHSAVAEEKDEGERTQEKHRWMSSHRQRTEQSQIPVEKTRPNLKDAITGELPNAGGPSIIGQAIGEAVRDNLDLSGSTQISMTDSEPSLVMEGRLQSKRTLHDDVVDTSASDSGSDGGWEDDPLLQMLRNQRALFHEQLRQIDSLLHQLEPEPEHEK